MEDKVVLVRTERPVNDATDVVSPVDFFILQLSSDCHSVGDYCARSGLTRAETIKSLRHLARAGLLEPTEEAIRLYSESSVIFMSRESSEARLGPMGLTMELDDISISEPLDVVSKRKLIPEDLFDESSFSDESVSSLGMSLAKRKWSDPDLPKIMKQETVVQDQEELDKELERLIGAQESDPNVAQAATELEEEIPRMDSDGESTPTLTDSEFYTRTDDD